MWGNVTETNCNISAPLWLLKNLFFFFECFYFSEYNNRMLLFAFWLRNRPSIKYVRKWKKRGGSSKKCTCAYSERRVGKLVKRYVRTKWMASNKFCGIFFIGSVKYTRASPPGRKMLLLSSIIITIVLLYAIIRI